MDKDLLQKHQNDPAWAEVIRLYSGLFDTQDQREDFILDLLSTNIVLASKCLLTSTKKEEKLTNNIKSVAINLFNYKSPYDIQEALITLNDLEQYDEIIFFFKSIDTFDFLKNPEKLRKEKLLNKTNRNVKFNSDLVLNIFEITSKFNFEAKYKNRINNFYKFILQNQDSDFYLTFLNKFYQVDKELILFIINHLSENTMISLLNKSHSRRHKGNNKLSILDCIFRLRQSFNIQFILEHINTSSNKMRDKIAVNIKKYNLHENIYFQNWLLANPTSKQKYEAKNRLEKEGTIIIESTYRNRRRKRKKSIK